MDGDNLKDKTITLQRQQESQDDNHDNHDDEDQRAETRDQTSNINDVFHLFFFAPISVTTPTAINLA